MTTLLDFLAGRLTEQARLWTSIGPLVLIAAIAAIGAVIFTISGRRDGRFRDPEIESRGATAVIGMQVRLFFAWLVAPVWKGLVRARVSPDAVTLLSLLLALAAGVTAGSGRFALAGWLYFAAGFCDFLDGRIARASGHSSARGAVLDSVVDRYAEGALIVGLVWAYRDSFVAVLALLALTGSFLVPYVRARGEAAGAVFRNVGLMQRPERIVLLGTTVALAPAVEVLFPTPADWPRHALAVAGLAVLALSSQYTAVERLRFVLGTLPGPAGDGERSPTRSLVGRALVGLGEVSLEAAAIWALTRIGVNVGVAFLLGTTLGVALRVRLDERGGASTWRVVFVALSTAVLVAGGVSILVAAGFHALGIFALPLAWALVRAVVGAVWERSLDDRLSLPPPAPTADGPKV